MINLTCLEFIKNHLRCLWLFMDRLKRGDADLKSGTMLADVGNLVVQEYKKIELKDVL